MIQIIQILGKLIIIFDYYMTYVVRVNHSIFALHPGIRTMFMTFKHKAHAAEVERSIRHFVMAHRTLPLTYPEAGGVMELGDPTAWLKIVNNLSVEEIAESDIMGLCEIHSAGRLHVVSMQEPKQHEGQLKFKFEGAIYDGEDMSYENMKKYLEYLIA